MAKETITVFDSTGRPREIPRADFMEKALPKMLEGSWDKPAELYQHIVFALNEGMHAGLVDAVKHLDELEAGAERSRVLLAATMFQNGRHEEAEAAIRSCIDKSGENATTVINLARIRAGRGDQADAERLLTRALELDPNQENALGWRCQLLHQAQGEAAVVAFLEELRSKPGRWRATLWLAQQKLRTNAHDDALALLRTCMTEVATDAGALMSITAELGKAGKLAEMVELCLPHHDPRRHRPESGFNLLQALIQLERQEEAKALFARIDALKLAPLGAALGHFAQLLGVTPLTPVPPPQAPQQGAPGAQVGASQNGAAPHGAAQGAAQPEQKLEIRLFVVQGPLWMQGLGAPWIGGEKDPKAPLITFVGFGDESLAQAKAKPHVDEERGRLARALPMYLCESVYLRTTANADLIVPLLPGGAFVVTGHLWPIEALIQGRPPEQKPDYIVQGLLAKDEGGYRVELVIFDGKSGAELQRLRQIGLRRLAGVALRVEDDLLEWFEKRGIARTAPKAGLLGKLLGGKKKDGTDLAVRPTGEKQDHHLLALANLLGLAMPAIGLGSRESLPDERGMVDSCIDLAKSEPHTACAKVVAACAVLFAVRFGSTQAERFKDELAKLIDADRDPQGVLRLLAPGLWYRLGDKVKGDAAKAQQLVAASGAYKDWLEALKA